MKNFIKVVGLLMVLMIMGCIQIDQEITLKKDGSGSIRLHYAMNEMWVQQMQAMQQMAEKMAQSSEKQGEKEKETMHSEESNFLPFEEEEIKKDFAGLEKEGITLKYVKQYNKDNFEHVDLAFDFKDFNKLNKVGMFKNNQYELVKNASGNYELRFKQQKEKGVREQEKDTAKPDEEVPMEGMDQMMAGFLKNMRISYVITVPTKIIKTNATTIEGNTARWIFDADKDPSIMKKMENMEIFVEFSGKGISIK